MSLNTNLYLPSAGHIITGKVLNATGAFSLSAGTPTNGVTLALDNSATNPNWMEIRSLRCSSDDTAARVLILGISPDNGTTFYPLGNISIPIGAGTVAAGTTPNVDLLNNSEFLGFQTDNGGNRFIRVPNLCVLMVGSLVQVSAGKALYITGEADVY